MLNRTFEPNMITMFGFVHTYLHAFRPYPFFSKIYCVHLLSSSTSWLNSGENQMKALKNRRKNIGICTIFSFLVSFFWGSYNNGSLILLILVYFFCVNKGVHECIFGPDSAPDSFSGKWL